MHVLETYTGSQGFVPRSHLSYLRDFQSTGTRLSPLGISRLELTLSLERKQQHCFVGDEGREVHLTHQGGVATTQAHQRFGHQEGFTRFPSGPFVSCIHSSAFDPNAFGRATTAMSERHSSPCVSTGLLQLWPTDLIC